MGKSGGGRKAVNARVNRSTVYEAFVTMHCVEMIGLFQVMKG